MTRKKENIFKKLLWWIPIIILGIMFALGACTRGDNAGTGKNSLNRIAESVTKKTEVQGDEGLKKDKDLSSESSGVEEGGNYTSKEDVALYIHTYGKLPINYITKVQAEELGWDPSKGNLSDVLPGRSIGGSAFGDYEGALPKAEGRRYFECDIDYEGGYRGAKRLVYSNDGLVFYTEDHYNTFEQLY